MGCDKNRVDTEKMLSFISERHQLTADMSQAEIIVITTCAFLESARREAIEEILSAGKLKGTAKLKKLIVTGCLAQKFINDIFGEMPEVDAFLGVSDYRLINDVIDRVMAGERVNAVGTPGKECGEKRVLTTENFAYLKIADGCSNHCTYCLIPKIRGKFRSVPVRDLLEEAAGLGEIKELILVAQDTAKYGSDLGKDITLTSLVRQLSRLENIKKIRLLYCYPENVTDELIEEIKCNEKVIKYIDMPMQHADDTVLKLMNRKGTGKGYLDLIGKLRKEISGISIRSTFITGFPGETDERFNTLVEFVIKARLDNVGFFAYSREEGTPAYNLDGQLPERIKRARLKKLYSVQQKVVSDMHRKLVGKNLTVTVDGFSEEYSAYYGRTYQSAPGVDWQVYFFSQSELSAGDEIQVKINDFKEFDLYGEQI